MADSISIVVWFPPDMSDKAYAGCNWPSKNITETDSIHADFRSIIVTSPLTGAKFKITPIGEQIRGAIQPPYIFKERRLHGRIVGYLVEVNPPACTVGHNRELVNGIPAAAWVALALLKYWLATNGCSREGIDSIHEENVVLLSVTPTYPFLLDSEDAARLSLAQMTSRAKTLLNKDKAENGGRNVAFSVPPKRPERGEYIYSSYIKRREYLIDAYVKRPDVSKAFLRPVADHMVELGFADRAKRSLRVGVKVNGKWLHDNGLSRISDWLGKEKPYEDVFALIRKDLRLDDNLRAKQLRAPSVKNLNLTDKQASVLGYHLKGNDAIDHDHFRKMIGNRAPKAFSAMKILIFERSGIDISVPYDAQKKQMHPELEKLLTFPGEIQSSAENAPYMFSRVSVDIALKKLSVLIELELSKKEPRQPTWPYSKTPLEATSGKWP